MEIWAGSGCFNLDTFVLRSRLLGGLAVTGTYSTSAVESMHLFPLTALTGLGQKSDIDTKGRDVELGRRTSGFLGHDEIGKRNASVTELKVIRRPTHARQISRQATVLLLEEQHEDPRPLNESDSLGLETIEISRECDSLPPPTSHVRSRSRERSI